MEGVSQGQGIVEESAEDKLRAMVDAQRVRNIEVESEEFRSGLQKISDAVDKFANEGIELDKVEENDGNSRHFTFEVNKVFKGDGVKVFGLSSGTGTIVKEKPDFSGITVGVDAIGIFDRGGRGPLINIIRRNASKTYIQVIELKDGVSFAEIDERGEDFFRDGEIKRIETMEIDNTKNRSKSESKEYDSVESVFKDSSQYRYIPEARVYHQPKLQGVINGLLTPLKEATVTALGNKKYEPQLISV